MEKSQALALINWKNFIFKTVTVYAFYFVSMFSYGGTTSSFAFIELSMSNNIMNTHQVIIGGSSTLGGIFPVACPIALGCSLGIALVCFLLTDRKPWFREHVDRSTIFANTFSITFPMIFTCVLPISTFLWFLHPLPDIARLIATIIFNGVMVFFLVYGLVRHVQMKRKYGGQAPFIPELKANESGEFVIEDSGAFYFIRDLTITVITLPYIGAVISVFAVRAVGFLSVFFLVMLITFGLYIPAWIIGYKRNKLPLKCSASADRIEFSHPKRKTDIIKWTNFTSIEIQVRGVSSGLVKMIEDKLGISSQSNLARQLVLKFRSGKKKVKTSKHGLFNDMKIKQFLQALINLAMELKKDVKVKRGTKKYYDLQDIK